jgi:hypothetical protein
MDREQRPCVTSRDSHYISTLRQVYSILESAYDDRPEHEKDVWNPQRMAIPISLSLSNVTLSSIASDNGGYEQQSRLTYGTVCRSTQKARAERDCSR